VRQVEYWRTKYGQYPFSIDYHYGLHHMKFFHDIYLDVARQLDIPHRHASQYTGAPKKGHLALYDKLNHANISVDYFLYALDRIKKRKYPTEVMLHLGDRAYGEKQFEILVHPRIRRKLAEFSIDMPHAIWMKLQKRPMSLDSFTQTSN
jgi:hypothetical protein